jgi:hypothetical protein
MGSNNSVPEKPTSASIHNNILSLFEQYKQNPTMTRDNQVDSLSSLDMSGEYTKPPQNRYDIVKKEIDVTLKGGMRMNGGMNGGMGMGGPLLQSGWIGGKRKPNIVDNYADDEDDDIIMEDSDLEEASPDGEIDQLGGRNPDDKTSDAFMSEIKNMTNVSQTSDGFAVANPPQVANTPQQVPQNVSKQVYSATSVSESPKRGGNGNGGSGCTVSIQDTKQLNGGCATCSMAGGNSNTNITNDSEEINMIPFSSASNSSEYFNNMQHEQRYT